jgi:hypothetical protein
MFVPINGVKSIDRVLIADLVETQRPDWARLGLTMPDADLRRRATDAIAAVIMEAIEPGTQVDHRQLSLRLR